MLAWRWGVCLAFVLGLLLPLRANAQTVPASTEGTVLQLDSGDVIVDIGASKGALVGAEVELWRSYRLKHPVTGATIVDRFRIGTVRLVQVRPNLSLGKLEGTLIRGVQIGDVVIVSTQKPSPAPTPSPTTTTSPNPTPTATTTPTSEEQELLVLFESLGGTSPLARSVAYGKFLQDHPSSHYTTVLREEIDALRAADRMSKLASGPPPTASVLFEPPSEAFADAPLSLGLEIAPEPQGAVTYLRRVGEVGYHPLPMTRVGRGFYVVTLAASEMQLHGIEYFIDAIDIHGKNSAAVGSSGDPRTIMVIERPQATPPLHVLATAAIWTDFAAFNAKKFNDYVSQTEGLFGARLADVGLRALRTGFGVYRGAGGSLDDLDNKNLDPRPIGLTYGYLEIEVAPSSIFSIIVRGIVGLRETGVDGGGQLFFRIGNDLKTNLLLGGEVLGGIGLRGIAELDWNTIRRVPIVIRTEVTNQPAGTGVTGPLQPNEAAGGGDVGARLIVQVGYRVTDHLTLALRASYQGRTINHSGPGGGAAVSYQW